MLKFIGGVSNESIVDIVGKVVKVKKPVKSCTVSDIELQILKFYVISRSDSVLPFQLEDACRKVENHREIESEDEDVKEPVDGKMPIVKLKIRLDNRIIDLRTPAN